MYLRAVDELAEAIVDPADGGAGGAGGSADPDERPDEAPEADSGDDEFFVGGSEHGVGAEPSAVTTLRELITLLANPPGPPSGAVEGSPESRGWGHS